MKKFLSLVLALVMTMSLVTISAGAKDFTDADKVTYTEAVDVLSAVKVIDGYTDGAFKPTTQLNRGQAAKILCNMILGPTTASALKADAAPFKDVAADNTFAAYIAYCAKEGIIDGYTDGTFRPTAPLTGYAFMKLLLGALGYDKDVEGYNGANWSINVAKRALAIGLDDGLVEDFDGTKIVTREEACLFALNTLKADMVEYDTKTSISVGGAEVVIAGSKAKAVEYKDGKYDGNIKDEDGVLQFAEKYFTNLTLKGTTDSFARPANQWKVKAAEIGVYTKKADATYTKKAKIADIYADLGLGKTVPAENVSVFEDGEYVDGAEMNIKKGDDDNGYGANGVKTEVFVSTVKPANGESYNVITVTMVNTYVGEIVKTVKATDKKDAYVVLSIEPGENEHPDGVGGKTLEFTTNETFEDGAKVLYTYSLDDEAVKSVAAAEKVSGTVTRAENKKDDLDEQKALTIDGETYKASAKIAGDDIGNVTVKNDYVVYLDSYGYMIFIAEDEYLSSDYALVLDAAKKDTFVGKKAELLFTDGTTKIVNTEKDYTGLKNTIVTYKVDDDGVYTLKAVSSKQSDGKTINETVFANDDSKFYLKSEKAGITVADKTVTANSATVFVVKTDLVDGEYTSYTGIKNAPTIEAKDEADKKADVYYFCKNGSMVTVMFVIPGAKLDIEDLSNKTVFLAVESVSNLIHDKDGDYYEYNATVNGELKTVKVAADVKVDTDPKTSAEAKALNGLFKSYTLNKYGIITSLRTYDKTYTGTSEETATFVGTGIDKVSKEYTVKLGTTSGENQVITVDEKAAIFYVDKKGNVSESSYKSIVVDTDDIVYAVVKDYLVKILYIQQVEAGKTAEAATIKAIAPTVLAANGTNAVAQDGKLTLAVAATVEKKNTEFQEYGWYVSTTDYAKIDDVEDNATLVDGDDSYIVGGYKLTCNVDTTTAGTYYYYVIVKTYDDKADGNGTTKAMAKMVVTVGEPEEPEVETYTLTLNGFTQNEVTVWNAAGTKAYDATKTIDGVSVKVPKTEATVIVKADTDADIAVGGHIVNNEVVTADTAGRLKLTLTADTTIKKTDTETALITVHLSDGIDVTGAKVVKKADGVAYLSATDNLTVTVATGAGTGYIVATDAYTKAGAGKTSGNIESVSAETWIYAAASVTPNNVTVKYDNNGTPTNVDFGQYVAVGTPLTFVPTQGDYVVDGVVGADISAGIPMPAETIAPAGAHEVALTNVKITISGEDYTDTVYVKHGTTTSAFTAAVPVTGKGTGVLNLAGTNDKHGSAYSPATVNADLDLAAAVKVTLTVTGTGTVKYEGAATTVTALSAAGNTYVLPTVQLIVSSATATVAGNDGTIIREGGNTIFTTGTEDVTVTIS